MFFQMFHLFLIFLGISELESNEKWMDLGNENRYVMRVKEGRVIP